MHIQSAFDIDLDIDPLWCAWFSGLVDGEGSFCIDVQNNTRSIKAYLAINMRADEFEGLRKIQDTLHCGNLVYQHCRKGNRNPAYQYRIEAKSSIGNILIPLFDRYHLRMKKRRDYEIWRKAALLICQDAHLNGYREEVLELKRRLEEGRRYKE